ncbi:unnamed protein product [Linum trigynum]|uniref:F-box domain-containing protein n=1 Tax=Linum trigynum TaxID=586398 RepID=A0AAV2CA84_9ROSI
MVGNSKRRKKKLEVRGHDVEEQIDRFSDLPDNIIERILSFLDTKSVVQTSILSRRWRCLWKAVPSLNFYRKCFRKKSSFIEHVNKFLSLRFDSVTVGSITFDFGRDLWRRDGIELFHSVMQHAAAGNGGHLRHLSIASAKSSDLAASIVVFDHHESLQILKLKGSDLHNSALASLGFKLLTTLELHRCHLPEPLANLPACLNYLKLLDCTSPHRMKVSAPQLLDLEIRSLNCGGVEVSASKHKSFRLGYDLIGLKVTPYTLNFPSLDHANIRIWSEPVVWSNDDDPILEDYCRAYMNLLRGLHNVEFLGLCFDKSDRGNPWQERLFSFSRMKPLIDSSEASPFTRLKTLTVLYPEDPPSLPYEVIRYFFESSSSTGEKSVKFEEDQISNGS